MRDYDPTRPLIFSHIPKTAGTSLRAVFEDWFGDRFHQHYRDPSAGLPERVALEGEGQGEGQAEREEESKPLVLYGHFNAALGFGIQDYYPEVEQFLTVMRDPFARVVSDYFFSLQEGRDMPPIDAFVLSYPSNPGGILNYFPFRVTADNYRELIERYFVDIGTTETLPQTVARFAARLGKACPTELPVINASRYTEPVPGHLEERFRERNRLECEVYDYVAARQQPIDRPATD